MAEQIVREIWLFQKRRTPPIDIVAGSQIPIALEMQDYTIPAGAVVKVYARPLGRETTYVQNATVSENTVVFTPQDGFFSAGGNSLQVEISGNKIPLIVDINCGIRLSDGGEGATPEAVRPLVARAEAAAKAAENSKDQAGTSAANAANSRAEAAKSEKSSGDNATAAAKSALEASTAEKKALEYRDAAKGFADTAAGYAGAAAVGIGWDSGGYFSIFETEED